MTYRDLDLRLIKALQADARRSNRQLAEELGVAASTVGHRLKHLEEGGVIRGYRPLIDYRALGLGLVAITRIKARGEALPNIVRSLIEHPHLTHVYEITGEFDVMVIGRFADESQNEPRDQEHARAPGNRGDEHVGGPGHAEGTARRGAPDRVTRPMSGPLLECLNSDVMACRRCSRLVEWREEVARTKRAAYRDDEYWGRPVPSFGDPAARILIVGLAPGAHGANRTGRMFTGDRSGEWLYGALHRAGLATRPESMWRDDGLELTNAWLTAAVRCVPPANRPAPGEREACRPFLEREIRALSGVRAIVALGGFAWDAALRALSGIGYAVPSPKPKFGHGAEAEIGTPPDAPAAAPSAVRRDRVLLGSYHPSQQNTFTGRLTRAMFDEVWARAVEIAG